MTFLFSALLGSPDFVQFEALRHNFGSRPRQESELSFDFKFVNSSQDSIAVKYVLPSCGCTTVDWTRNKLAPGETGVVSVTYHREYYKFSFDRSVSVFFEGHNAPVHLSFFGTYYETRESLAEDFPIERAPLAFSVDTVDLGTISPYKPVLKEFKLANISDKSLTLEFSDFSEGLSMDSPSVEIPAVSRLYLNFIVVADSLVWGRRSFTVTPSVGNVAMPPIVFNAIVLEDYSSLSQKEINQGSFFKVNGRVHHFGVIRAGNDARLTISLENISDKPLRIKSAILDAVGAEISAPDVIEPRSRAEVDIKIPASSLVAGPNDMILSLVTNSPLLPYIEIPIQGYVES